MKTYKPSGFDLPALLQTYGVPLLFAIAIAVFTAGIAQKFDEIPFHIPIPFALFIGTNHFIHWTFGVRTYRITNDYFQVVKNLNEPMTVALSDITDIVPATQGALHGTEEPQMWSWVQTFGYKGYRHYRGLGRCRLAATNMWEAVIIHRKDDIPLIISPEYPEAFVAETLPLLLADA